MGGLSRAAPGILGVVAAVALAVGTPAMVYRQGDIVSGILVFFAVAGAALTAIVGIDQMGSYTGLEEERWEELIRSYAARQRALLEELDEAVETLREIRDLLRRGVE